MDEQDVMEWSAWKARKSLGELVESANAAIDQFNWLYLMEQKLEKVWKNHHNGEQKLGELSAKTFKAVLDSLSTDEQAGTTSVPALS